MMKDNILRSIVFSFWILKNAHKGRVLNYLAEDKRFELSKAFTLPPFQDGALSHSANPPTLHHYNKFMMQCHGIILIK